MNSMDNEIVKDLNELLSGCHMGASTFKEYLVEAQSVKRNIKAFVRYFSET